MAPTVIRACGISKQYRLGARFQPGQRNIREVLMEAFYAPAKHLRRRWQGGAAEPKAAARKSSVLWALQDVSFDVAQGEVVGIIGRNGAGKSTLLKILSRITEPTSGEATVFGRVGSLLEVATGFHPELTGRENIFLNGAILGMLRAEIIRKFDDIVAFAEVERFLDTPVKFYSSGMYTKLAFAVAAHFEPEILIVDEVLAVGDAMFRKKCLGKMGDVAKSGRTVLFVSHNAHAIRSLCTRAILLRSGTVHADGNTLEVMAQYERENQSVRFTADTAAQDSSQRHSDHPGVARFTFIEVQDDRGQTRGEFEPGEAIRFSAEYECLDAVNDLWLVITLKCEEADRDVTTLRHRLNRGRLPRGTRGKVVLEVPNNPLRPGTYPLWFWLGGEGTTLNDSYDVVHGSIEPLVVYSTKSIDELGYDPSNQAGYFSLDFRPVGP
jgi:lipopolysaccharide transport system ATP-binding protein